MDSEVKPFLQTIDLLHEDIYRAVEPLTDDGINWRHPHLTNTVGILLRHVAGSERQWILEAVGGRSIQRKRDEEFGRERLRKAPLVENLRRAQAEVKEMLEGMSAGRLMEEVEQTFRGKTVTFTKSWGILHSIQHTAYHLGQIQLFSKMATSGAAEQLRPGR
ncbi:MAG: DinB family protein [Armatimonadetes bacterium]|nr:DinB family protein [Armatimonadota bacterium]